MRKFTKKGKPSSKSDNAMEGDGVGKGDVDALGGRRGTRLIGGHREECGGEGGWRVASECEQWSYSC